MFSQLFKIECDQQISAWEVLIGLNVFQIKLLS
jgi:hypothetical protein